MRRAPRHPGRFTPALQPLEGRVVLSYGPGAGPTVAILAAPIAASTSLAHEADATPTPPWDSHGDGAPPPGPTAGVVLLKSTNRADSGVAPSGFGGALVAFKADFSGGFFGFGLGRGPGGPWRDGGRLASDASTFATSSDSPFVGPPAPEGSDASVLVQTSSATPTRGGEWGWARLGPFVQTRSGPGPVAPQPNEFQSRPGGSIPRGPFEPPVLVESASPTTPATLGPPAPGLPPLSAAGAPDLARPLAATNVAWSATMASFNLGTPVPADVRAIAPGAAATASGTGGGVIAATAPAPQGGGDLRTASTDAATAHADADASPPAEAPAPIGAGVLTGFLPLDRATVDLALAKVMGQLDDMGSPLAGPSSRLPLALPVAAALAAAEAARRWRARTSIPGPSAARGSRFSSLRGLS